MTRSTDRAAAAAVREALRARGLQQRDAARVIGRSQAAMSDRLTGKTPFTLKELDALSEWLGIPLAQLLEPPALLVDVDESEARDEH